MGFGRVQVPPPRDNIVNVVNYYTVILIYVAKLASCPIYVLTCDKTSHSLRVTLFVQTMVQNHLTCHLADKSEYGIPFNVRHADQVARATNSILNEICQTVGIDDFAKLTSYTLNH